MSPAAASRTEAPYGRRVAEAGLGAAARLMLDEVSDGARVLDVGCATGYLAEPLTRRGCTVLGFEMDPASAAAAARWCEHVIVGDVQDPGTRALIPGVFDVILLGDVLEHLVDPWETLGSMRTHLAAGGVVVASIPNVAAWTVRLALLSGRFRYEEMGIMDRTHLRFFTRATVHELVRDAGYAVERERHAPIEQAPGLLRRTLPRATDVAVKSLLRVWPELMAQQFVLRLRPAPGGRSG